MYSTKKPPKIYADKTCHPKHENHVTGYFDVFKEECYERVLFDPLASIEHAIYELDANGDPTCRYTLGPNPDEIICKRLYSEEHSAKLRQKYGSAHTGDVNEFVLVATGGDVSISNNAKINSGKIGANIAGSKVSLGNNVETLRATSLLGDTIAMGNNNTIAGPIYYNTLTKKSNNKITGGTYTPLLLPVVSALPSLPDFTAGTQNLTINNNQTYSLSAGSYGKVYIGNNCRITFNAGAYNIKDLQINNNVSVGANNYSPVQINISGTVKIGNNLTFNNNGSASSAVINYSGTSDISLGNNIIFTGLLLAPNARFSIGNNSTLKGAFIAKAISVSNNSTFTWDTGFTAGPEKIYYHYDGLGSVVALTDRSGNLVASYDYSPFGVIVNTTGDAATNQYTYTGREYLPEMGEYYYRTRYYLPDKGRFGSLDRMWYMKNAGDIDGIQHSYGYVGNNAVNRRDAMGMVVEPWMREQSNKDKFYSQIISHMLEWVDLDIRFVSLNGVERYGGGTGRDWGQPLTWDKLPDGKGERQE